jgi:hypothetical protein
LILLGSSGEVYYGEWLDSPVALKKLKSDEEFEEFKVEAGRKFFEISKGYRHSFVSYIYIILYPFLGNCHIQISFNFMEFSLEILENTIW